MPGGETAPHQRSIVADVDCDRRRLQRTLEAATEVFGVRAAAVSVAVASSGVVSAAVGTDCDGAPLDEQSAFRVGSVSKTLAAAAIIGWALADGVSLDADVRDLVAWRPERVAGVTDGTISLARLLSHTAGLGVHGYLGYPPDAPVPSIRQVVLGEPPATGERLCVICEPGTVVRYSGGGYSVAQMVAEELAGRSLADLVHRFVIDPLALHRTWVGEPPDPVGRAHRGGRNSRAGRRGLVDGFADGEPVAGRWMVHPELAAAGAWSTARDLVTVGTAIAAGRRGLGPLPADVVELMLRPSGCPGEAAGHGIFLDDATDPSWAYHSGGVIGYQAIMLTSLDGSIVAAATTNDWPRGAPCYRSVLRTHLDEYGPPPSFL